MTARFVGSEPCPVETRERTKVGPGYFVTFLEVYRNQKQQVVGRVTLTVLQ
jgi:hypothetical protein